MKTILIHVATLLLAGFWFAVAFASLFIRGSSRRHELGEWWAAIGAIVLPLAVAALYAWLGWGLFGLPAVVSSIGLALPGLVALYVHGSGLLRVLRARPLHRSLLSIYYRTPRGIQIDNEPIEGCDPASFRVIGGTYARDRSQVFFRAEKVSGADPDSFSVISLSDREEPFAAYDGRNVYLNARRAPQLSVSGMTWRSGPSYRTALVHGGNTAFLILSGSCVLEIGDTDPSLRFISTTALETIRHGIPSYLLDARRVYHYGWDAQGKEHRMLITAADPQTFRWVGSNGDDATFDAEDANHKFKKGAIVQ